MPQTRSKRVFLKMASIVAVFLLIYSISYFINPFSSVWRIYLERTTLSLILEGIVSLLMSWAIIEVNIFIAKKLNHRFSWTTAPVKRFFVQMALVIITVTILLYVQDLYYFLKRGGITTSRENTIKWWCFFIGTLIVSILVSGIHSGYFFLKHWKQSMSETAELRIKTLELKEVAMQAELQSLKLQLDPHFMFNNFSTLSELIDKDKTLAESFLDNLSNVYRYMIQNLKKDLVRLDEELVFVKAYNYLIEIRHGQNVKITIKIAEAFKKKYIPPITLQLLIENAIKHNKATTATPLLIEINLNEEKNLLSVKNNLQRIIHSLPTTQLGLANIFNRYKLLSDKLPTLKETETYFEVDLPLLD